MKVTIKTIAKTSFSIEVPDDATVADLKSCIEHEHHYPVPVQTLVYAGTVLKDPDSLSKLGIKEGSTLIFFEKKPKNQPATQAPSHPPQTQPSTSTPAPKPASESPAVPASAPATTTAAAPATTTATEPPKDTASPATQPPQESTTTPPQTPPAAPQQGSTTAINSSPVIPNPANSDSSIERLVNMGFLRSDAEAALRASFGDPNRAIDLLTSGMPIPDAPSDDGAAAGLLGDLPAESGPTPLLDELPTHPQFQAIRRIVSTGPQGLQLLLQTLSETMPQLAQEIVQHPMKFTQVITGMAHPPVIPGGGEESEEEQSSSTGTSTPSTQGSQTSSSASLDSATRTPAAMNQLSQADEPNIQQIIAITGASRPAAIQAYIVCDKNVESAINLLFDS